MCYTTQTMQQINTIFLIVAVLITLGAGCTKTETSRTYSYNNGLTAEDIFVKNKPVTNNYQANPTPPSEPLTTTTNSPVTTTNPMEFNASTHYAAVLHTTKGDIEIDLNFGQTPNTVKNFVDLAQKNFYDQTIFHRAIKGFMIQGGDPKGNGTGGPGYKFNDEPFTGEYTRGAVAMANAGPNTNGSQFFIMHADYPLPKDYTIFGHVTKGIEVVDLIANDAVKMSGSGELSQPVNPTTVSSIEILEK